MATPEALRWAASVLPGFDPHDGPAVQPLAGGGSERRLSRLFLPDRRVILVENPSTPSDGPDENDSFVYLAGHLRRRGVPVPEVLAYSRERGAYLMEDLGDRDLYGEKTEGGAVERLYAEAVEVLARMQVDALEGFDPARCHSPPRYDRELMLRWESGYFQRELLEGRLALGPPSASLRREYALLAERAGEAGAGFFLHRDFQSTNLKVREGRIWVIDFQGARLGPPQYDLAALLYDPYTDLSEALRGALLERYLDIFLRRSGVARGAFLAPFPYVAVHRAMQAIGAFCFLGHRRGKAFFLPFIPTGLGILDGLLGKLPPQECAALRRNVALARERVGQRR